MSTIRHVRGAPTVNGALKALAALVVQMAEVVSRDADDPESEHALADELLVQALEAVAARLDEDESAAVAALIESYHSVFKWYA